MTQRPRLAGGFFLIAAILAGSVWGAVTGHLILGIGIGLASGVAMSLAVWWLDRRPPGRGDRR